jgi:tricorn protease
MPSEVGYYRHPTIHGDSIVFVCEEDLWSVSIRGGTAHRLTANPGTISFPSFSPDGTKIAFTGKDDGPLDVYVIDRDGGSTRRLTWLGGASAVAGWSPDGKGILFASDWRQPFRGYHHLYSVPAAGGSPKPLRHGPARSIAHEPGGSGVVIGRNTGDPARWKRYRGGTAGTLWIDRRGDGVFVPLINLAGNLAGPMWVGKRIYFLSDHEGFGNLYSCTSAGRDLRRHTHHEDFYVRFPSTDGSRIVYHAGADLYLFDPARKESVKLDVRVVSPRAQRNRKFVPAGKFLERFDLHPKGHSIATVNRGGIYAMGLWEGAATRLSDPTGVRYRLARWLPDGRRIVAVSDEGGEEGLVILSANGQEKPRRLEGDFGRPVDLFVAPAGPERVALTNQRQELIVVDLKTGRSRAVEHSPFARIDGAAWSPDGAWLAYGYPSTRRTSCICLYNTASGAVSRVTRPDFWDGRPSFDPEGKYLYFVSTRIFDPIADSLYFDYGFPKGSVPCLIPLKKETVSPFSLTASTPRAPGSPAWGEAAQNAAAKGKAEESKKGSQPVAIDLDGIEGRIIAFPVPEGRYLRVVGARGRALFSSFPVEGILDQNWLEIAEPPAKGRVETYDFETLKTETVQDRITDFALSMDAKVMGIRVGNRLRAVPVTFKADQKPGPDLPGRESGWLDIERIRVSVVPGDEWRQMLREAWRLQRDQFWTPDMSGHDWKRVLDRYSPLVDRVASRAEFSDLVWELQGELGTSHCYEMGGDYRPEPAWFQGVLGADLDFDRKTGTWRIARIPRGDSWDEKRSSPLAAPGLNLTEGDEILAVAGMPVGKDASPHERLVHLAGQDVQLTVRCRTAPPARGGKRAVAKPARDEVRTVTVKTMRDETGLRYRDWVERNRAFVHDRTNGRVGYVHIPDMGGFGFSEFHRYYLSEIDHDGLIIDVRHNGGGSVSQLVLAKLVQKRIGYDANRWGRPEPYPTDAPMGPMVALTDEHAGSDGDIFSHCFKLYGLGPLIGKRTWGGVVGIWPRHALVDGTFTSQPEFAFWFKDVGWGVENYGTEPDIEVEITPQDHGKGRDPQMERGIEEIAKILRKRPGKKPDFKDRPKIAPGRLPAAR